MTEREQKIMRKLGELLRELEEKAEGWRKRRDRAKTEWTMGYAEGVFRGYLDAAVDLLDTIEEIKATILAEREA